MRWRFVGAECLRIMSCGWSVGSCYSERLRRSHSGLLCQSLFALLLYLRSWDMASNSLLLFLTKGAGGKLAGSVSCGMEAQISTHRAPDRPRGSERASVNVLKSRKRNAAAIVSRKGAMFVSRVGYTRRLYCPTLPFAATMLSQCFGTQLTSIQHHAKRRGTWRSGHLINIYVSSLLVEISPHDLKSISPDRQEGTTMRCYMTWLVATI